MSSPLDLDLLQTFVAVLDIGGFTRAAGRLHRTQSTVSQQIRRLEEQVGHPLLTRERAGSLVRATAEGERLLDYARRMLALSAEAQEVMRRPAAPRSVRLGVTEDFASRRLVDLLAGFAQAHRAVRLHTVSAWSAPLRHQLDAGEIDLALVKQEPNETACLARRTERLVWVGAWDRQDTVPLALFPQGCIYRTRAIAALEARAIPWHVAYTSQGLAGVQAAVASGLGVSLLPEDAVAADHRVIAGDLPAQPSAEIALVARPGRLEAHGRLLADYLADTVFAAS